MSELIIENKSAEEISKQGTEFENYLFKDCDLSNSVLSNYKFIDCVFDNCNLSMVKLSDTVIRDSEFVNCKILGVNFFECNDFIFTCKFVNCMMKYASFKNMNIKGFEFTDCNMDEVDFFAANLSNSVLKRCSLHRAIFSDTNLEKADLSTALNFSIDPDRNKIKKAKFSRMGLSGLLDKYNIIVE